MRLVSLLGALCAALAAACSDSSGPQPQAAVTGVSPASGPTTGGTPVTVTGTSFPTSVDSVRIGAGQLSAWSRVNATRLTGTTPAASAAGAVDITLFGAGDTTATCRGCFTYTPAVTLTSVSPGHGPQGGGTAVTITGAGFPLMVDSVLIGAAHLTNVVRVSATQLTGTTPLSSVAGSVSVTVWVGGAWGGSCTACFTYDPTVVVTSVSPTAGPMAGGTALTIAGMAFPAIVDSVLVGAGRLANLARVSATQLTGTTPAAGTPGKVDVVVYTTSAGSDTCAACFTYAAFARYIVTFLGVGFDSSRAVDMNDSGVVVGLAWNAGTGPRGHLWVAGGAPTDLGALIPVAINNLGTVLGTIEDPDRTPALWENGTVQALGGLDAVDTTAAHVTATDINDQRQVALLGFHLSGLGNLGVFLWQNDSAYFRPCGLGADKVGRLNAGGDIAASCEQVLDFPPYTPHWGAFLVQAESTTAFGFGAAIAVNDAGWVIGFLGIQPLVEPALFGHGSPPLHLSFAPAAINNALQVVGEGYLWQDSVAVSLSSLATDSVWQISGAVAINDRGQIAAYGVNSATGQQGAVRLDPIASASGSSTNRRP